MNSRNLCSFLFVILFWNGLFGQINSGFIEHLSKNNMRMEHWEYLERNLTTNDSLHYYRAKFHLQYGNDSALISSLRLCRPIFLSDSLAVKRANYYFLTSDKNYSDEWFNEMSYHGEPTFGIPFVYHSANNPRTVNLDLVPKRLRSDLLRLGKADRKKPLLAASLSAVIPGAGKLYIGSTRSFLLTFVSVSLLGFQAWESSKKMGIQHPLSILNIGLFSAYYVVNIFGSYRETKQKKQEIRKQYLINASKHFHSDSGASLY